MPFLVTELRGDIALIGLNRPDKRNAICDAVIGELEAAVDWAERHAKAGIVHGAGPHFCAGLDLAEHLGKSAFDGLHGSRRWHRAFDRIHRGRLPWFSALHGAVVGGGLELASA
ncbi:MAG: enoyl-CoA hydratase/isomerase family protein, partial [Alphaproteobacteria bacterium]|nr:enoyl-CoA hydratase/isomerase family protein [Alphaproteobacteria bacterium]